jgi:hypothetical protein
VERGVHYDCASLRVGGGGASFNDSKKRRLFYLILFLALDSPFKLGLGLAGSLVGVIVNLLVVVAVRTDSRLVIL